LLTATFKNLHIENSKIWIWMTIAKLLLDIAAIVSTPMGTILATISVEVILGVLAGRMSI